MIPVSLPENVFFGAEKLKDLCTQIAQHDISSEVFWKEILEMIQLAEEKKHFDDVSFIIEKTTEYIYSVDLFGDTELKVSDEIIKNSPYFPLFQSKFLSEVAWAYRGHGFISEVSEKDHKKFLQYSEKAHEILLAEEHKNALFEKTPLFYGALSGLALPLNLTRIENGTTIILAEEYAKKAIEKDYEYTTGHQRLLNIYNPKWGDSSVENMCDYALQVFEKSKEGSANGMLLFQVCLEIICLYSDDPFLLSEEQVHGLKKDSPSLFQEQSWVNHPFRTLDSAFCILKKAYDTSIGNPKYSTTLSDQSLRQYAVFFYALFPEQYKKALTTELKSITHASSVWQGHHIAEKFGLGSGEELLLMLKAQYNTDSFQDDAIQEGQSVIYNIIRWGVLWGASGGIFYVLLLILPQLIQKGLSLDSLSSLVSSIQHTLPPSEQMTLGVLVGTGLLAFLWGLFHFLVLFDRTTVELSRDFFYSKKSGKILWTDIISVNRVHEGVYDHISVWYTNKKGKEKEIILQEKQFGLFFDADEFLLRLKAWRSYGLGKALGKK